MTEKQSEIIAKVKKLLRLAANSPFESEAQAAAAKAQELLCEYHLTMSDMGDLNDEYDCDESEYYVLRTGYIPTHIKFLVLAIEQNFSVEGIFSPVSKFSRAVSFVGTVPDCHIARQLFEFLMEFASRKAREHGFAGARRSAFLQGFSLTVYERLRKQAQDRQQKIVQEKALVQSRQGAVEAYLRQKYDISWARACKASGDQASIRAGYREGETVSLDRPIDESGMVLSIGA